MSKIFFGVTGHGFPIRKAAVPVTLYYDNESQTVLNRRQVPQWGDWRGWRPSLAALL